MAPAALVRGIIFALAAALALSQARLTHKAGSGDRVSLLRDTEIEGDIHTMMTPIWEAAGLDPDAVHVYVVSDDRINSIVAGGQNIFINSGYCCASTCPTS